MNVIVDSAFTHIKLYSASAGYQVWLCGGYHNDCFAALELSDISNVLLFLHVGVCLKHSTSRVVKL